MIERAKRRIEVTQKEPFLAAISPSLSLWGSKVAQHAV